ncbi:MAG: DUF4249 domain-containing protein [Bacteroidales bacterium]|nr:DUF4249 domain-containing protein [Bacteroidales bacterium]
MRKISLNIILILFVIFSLACKEEFQLESKDYQELMVFEGFITNEPGPYTIKVSKSATINKPLEIPLRDCEVIIYDDKGYSEVLIETEPGSYITKKEGIKGTVGNKYRISVTTPDNNKYETVFQEMQEPVEIDSLYAKLEYHEIVNDLVDLPGYQFYVNTETAQKDSSYFLWDLTETYEYNADFTLFAIRTVYGMTYCNNDTGCPDLSPYYTCWRTAPVKKMYTAETASLTFPKIKNKKLHFVGTDSKRLTEIYSILVGQYHIDKDAYTFWKAFENQISEDNFLFSTQPSNIKSNIKNINNPDETILGYFTVGSRTQKRIFVENPREGFSYEKCYVITDWSELRRPLPWYFTLDEGTMGVVEYDCLDCRSHGGVLEKPDYWIN